MRYRSEISPKSQNLQHPEVGYESEEVHLKMIEQHFISIESPSDWKEALNGINHSFGHTWENCYAQYLTTGFKTYLYCFESDRGQIVCPIVEREYEGYIDILKPFGFSGFVENGNCDDFPICWKEFVEEKQYVCGYLGLDPIFNSISHFPSEEIYQYNTVHVLDLTLTEGELFANLSENRKRQLRNWHTVQSNFVFDRSRLKDFFLTNYVEFFRRVEASSYYSFSQETLSFLFSLDNVVLVGGQDADGNIVAVSVFTYTPYVGEYLFNVSLPEGQHYAAPLIWYGVNHLKSLQIPSINLGGGKASLSEFKRRFGGKQYPLRCLKQVYEPEIYQKLCRERNADPNDMVGYFPGYRKH